MKKYKSSQEAVDESNRQLWREKMKALEESKGDLGELVRRTPGASAVIERKDGSKILISKGPKDTSDQPIIDYRNRYKEYR